MEVSDWVKPGDVVVVVLDDLRMRVETTDLLERDVPNVKPAGKREILGVSVSTSEYEVHWRAFLESPKQRGLGSVQLTLAPHASAGVTSDDHAGLHAARLAVFDGLPWQRCHARICKLKSQQTFRTVFDAPERTTAEAYLAKAVNKYQTSASCLSQWLAAHIPEGLTVVAFPATFRSCCTPPTAQ